mmetsp:Transcript_12066/g.48552  ORF Transcript_12066/g.48552 Transcript_12066/m.48552 type:complete len:95 (-) Transcript_12066:207-491(-)
MGGGKAVASVREAAADVGSTVELAKAGGPDDEKRDVSADYFFAVSGLPEEAEDDEPAAASEAVEPSSFVEEAAPAAPSAPAAESAAPERTPYAL